MKPIKGWKIAYSLDLGLFEVDEEVRKNTLAALDVFRSLGATVEEVDVGWKPGVLEAGMAYLEHIFGGYLSSLLEEHGDEMTTYARQFAQLGGKSTSADFVSSLETIAEMYTTFGPMMENYDVFICPTNSATDIPADFDHSKDVFHINGKEVNPSLGWVMTTPFNMLSRCPVLSVPSGHASNGVPTGIQIVGRTYCDADVFRAGLAFEAARGPWYGNAANRPAL